MENFNDKYFPKQMRDKKLRKFLNLMRHSRSVQAYETRFVSLSRFAPHIVVNEELKVKRFEGGLRPSIRDRIVTLKLRTYAKMVERTKIIESTTKEGQQKAKMTPPKSGPDGQNQEKPNKKQRVVTSYNFC